METDNTVYLQRVEEHRKAYEKRRARALAQSIQEQDVFEFLPKKAET